MGSRWKGTIELGAMLNSTATRDSVTTWILNWLYCSRFSDIIAACVGSRATRSCDGAPEESWSTRRNDLKLVHMELRTTRFR